MNDALPIDAHLPAIVAALRAHPSLVLVAEPGAGKTTRVPRALLDAGFSAEGDVVVLEPRRIAARLAARRVASELGEEVGRRIGYQVRFEDRTSRDTRVRFVTEGVFVRRLTGDPSLRGTSVVVFDELHERHLHTDLALGWCRALQASGHPLRLVAMSATLDAGPISRFLGDAPIIEVPGRTYPVDLEYAERDDSRPLGARVGQATRRVLRETPAGDVLVFLPGAGEIRRAREALGGVDAEVVALHGDLPPAEQDRALASSPRRKVILSTNVAESSLTVPGVTTVIDSGLARIARFSPWTGLPSLLTGRISQASAKQRAGRAGRLRPGRCLRLYTKHDHDAREAFDAPEILRADLSELVLFLAGRGRTPEDLPFLDPPPAAAVDAARALLIRLGALTETAQSGRTHWPITPLGDRMLALPAHPRLARLVLEAADRGAGARGALLAALAGGRDVRLTSRRRFEDAPSDVEVGSSDLLAQLASIEAAEAEGLSARELRARDLDVTSFTEVRRARDQLARAARLSPHPEASLEDEEEALLLATLAAFPDRVAKRRRANQPQVVFAAGGSAELATTSVVREAEFLVAVDVAELEGPSRAGVARARMPVVRAASEVEPVHLLELFPERVEERRTLRFDPATQMVEASEALVYEGLVLEESVRRDVEGEDVARVLARAAIDHGLEKLFDLDAIENLRRRLAFAAAHGLALPAAPSSDTDAPAEGRVPESFVHHALEDLCLGRRSFADLRGASLEGAMLARLAPKEATRLRALAPESIALPGRARVPIRYEVDRAPWIESRLQDFFGMRRGPHVADGRVPLVLHLLAPNYRAVQVTTDLEGFWPRHYPALRKELMRRYPKHAWPEDPLTATPPSRRR